MSVLWGEEYFTASKHHPTKRKKGKENEPEVSLLEYGVMVWSEIFLVAMNNDNVE